jgi:phospholipase C
MNGRNVLWAVIAVVIVLIIVLTLVYVYTLNQNTASTTVFTPAKAVSPIQHIVVIMQENRAFDNLFWTYPGVMGGIKDYGSYCIPYNVATPSDCVMPTLSNYPAISGDLPHTFTASYISYDNGKMDGFLQSAGGNLNSTIYYDNSTVPTYWSYAQHYTLDDNSHSSVMSYSQPNHWYMIAGASPNASLYEGATQEGHQCVSNGQINWSNCIYFQEANKTQTIIDLLQSSSVTWKYYDTPLDPSYDQSIMTSMGKGQGGAYEYWNTLAAKETSYTEFRSHFVWRGQILDDIRNGTLSEISWVIPSGGISDHPPASLLLGQVWVADIVDTIMKSSYWNNTAIILTWDDFGGFFDVLPPPVVQIPVVTTTGQVVDVPYGMGFRTPMIIISPYAKAGYIDHTLYSFESILRFIIWDYGISAHFTNPLQQANVANSNNLLNSFNFNQRPLGTDIIPLNSTELYSIQNCIWQNCEVNVNPGLVPLRGIGSSEDYSGFIGGDPD